MPRGLDERERNRYLDRRQWLSMLGVGGAAGLAGCLGDNDEDETNPDDTGGDDTGGDDTGGDDTGGDDTGGDDTGSEDDSVEFPAVSGTYDTASGAAFETLNPIYNNEDGAATAIGRALDQGYTFDANGDVFPLLYDLNTDQSEVWVFEVREDLQFSDPYGQVTADDFVYQIQEVQQSDWAGTPDFSDWADVNVEQVNDFEFQAELQNPQPLWPETFAPLLYPVPIDIMEPYVQEQDAEGFRQDEELLELQFTGNLGAFTLDTWERDAGTRYSRNDDYYIQNLEYGPELFQQAPYFEGANIDVIPEQSARLGELQTGNVDSAAIPPERVSEFDGMDNIDVLRQPTPFNTGGLMAVNMRDNGWNAGPGNLFRQTEFRQAIASAINKRELIEGIFFGLASEHFTWQPEFSQWFPGRDNIETWGVGDRYGEEVAKGLAEEAFANSEFDYRFDGDALVTPDGDQVTLENYVFNGSETRIQVGEFVAQELSDNLGIDVSVEPVDGVTYSEQYWSAEDNVAEPGETRTINGEEVTWDQGSLNPNNPGPRDVTSANGWDMSIVFGLNTYPQNPITNQAFFDGPTARYNPVGYYPEFNATDLFTQMREATSRAGIQEAATELFENLNREQPYIMIAFPDDTPGVNSDLIHDGPGPAENFYSGWNLPAWYFDE